MAERRSSSLLRRRVFTVRRTLSPCSNLILAESMGKKSRRLLFSFTDSSRTNDNCSPIFGRVPLALAR